MLRGTVLPLALQAGQDLLHPHSSAEHRITVLWWVMLAGAWIGFARGCDPAPARLVRRRQESLPFGGQRAGRDAARRRARHRAADRRAHRPLRLVGHLRHAVDCGAAPGSTALTIDVIGHQWWWEVRYPGTRRRHRERDPHPDRHARRRRRHDRRRDPQLLGPGAESEDRPDPGRARTRVLLDATRPGVFRGQCSEFCGLQHAHMARRGRRRAARSASSSGWPAWRRRHSRRAATAQRGRAVFLAEPLRRAAIRSAARRARGDVGPDLTHLAARTTLAALTIPNTPRNLARWIARPAARASRATRCRRSPLTTLRADRADRLPGCVCADGGRPTPGSSAVRCDASSASGCRAPACSAG